MDEAAAARQRAQAQLDSIHNESNESTRPARSFRAVHWRGGWRGLGAASRSQTVFEQLRSCANRRCVAASVCAWRSRPRNCLLRYMARDADALEALMKVLVILFW